MTPHCDDRAALSFLQGHGLDARGRTLDELLAFDDEALEHTHDAIQWLFPASLPSAFNPDAPVLSAAGFEQLAMDTLALKGLRRATARMLRFFGFELVLGSDGRVRALARLPRFELRTEHWLFEPTHNDLRVTRMLGCLAQAGEGSLARRIHDELARAVTEHRVEGAQVPLGYWAGALGVTGAVCTRG